MFELFLDFIISKSSISKIVSLTLNINHDVAIIRPNCIFFLSS
ncbi:protein of unknown function [Candidatus Nitrosacidococcus tergens]|uniref:Uncharacterized protein n=1 Tax=Candidatus Nitrosacidococcus tergens TaxID=553981 RepID=A0A7G1Q9W4_9GAMM|nr:protein of unknown function [Candidatus Nitrosacidococcus tergens]